MRRVSVKAIERGWDDPVRLSALIRAGKVSAAHAIYRLGSAAVGDPLHRATHGRQVAPELGRRRKEMAATISSAHAQLTNIVLAWNTHRMGGVVARLERDGVGIEEDWLRRIGPAHF
jgi:TnpA family transposase